MSFYQIHGFITYIILFVICGYALFSLNRSFRLKKALHQNDSTYKTSRLYPIATGIMIIATLMMVLDMLIWINHGYIEEINLTDTLGPVLLIIGVTLTAGLSEKIRWEFETDHIKIVNFKLTHKKDKN